MAYLVAKNPAAAGLYPQLAYLLDISNIARNALALPLPGEDPVPPPPPSPAAPAAAAAARATAAAAAAALDTPPQRVARGQEPPGTPPTAAAVAARSKSQAQPLQPRRLFGV